MGGKEKEEEEEVHLERRRTEVGSCFFVVVGTDVICQRTFVHFRISCKWHRFQGI